VSNASAQTSTPCAKNARMVISWRKEWDLNLGSAWNQVKSQ